MTEGETSTTQTNELKILKIMDYRKINSIEDLNRALDEELNDFFILLGGGLLRSSKRIEYAENPDSYHVYHSIDDTEEKLTAEEMMDEEKSNIGKAMRLGCFFCETND